MAYASYPEGTLWKSKSDGSQRVQLTYPPFAAVLPSWSPDGQQLVFYGLLPGQKSKLYTVSADGGTPRKIMPEDPQEQYDPTWSPDGTKIAFGGPPSDPNTAIRILDVRTNQISTVHGSKGLYSPRWSPDGRYIVAMPFASRSLMLFDSATQKWAEIAKITCGFPQLVEKQRLCLLLARGEPAVGDASTHSRPQDRASGRPEKLPASRLLECLARYGSRRFTPLASRHRHSGNLLSRLASSVTSHSQLPQEGITVAIAL